MLCPVPSSDLSSETGKIRRQQMRTSKKLRIRNEEPLTRWCSPRSCGGRVMGRARYVSGTALHCVLGGERHFTPMCNCSRSAVSCQELLAKRHQPPGAGTQACRDLLGGLCRSHGLGNGHSAPAGHCRAFNSQPGNDSVVELYLPGAADRC